MMRSAISSVIVVDRIELLVTHSVNSNFFFLGVELQEVTCYNVYKAERTLLIVRKEAEKWN